MTKSIAVLLAWIIATLGCMVVTGMFIMGLTSVWAFSVTLACWSAMSFLLAKSMD